MKNSITTEQAICYHCGEDCDTNDIQEGDKLFCCEGCKTVYDILNKNNLCDYYAISDAPGIRQKQKVREGKFALLDDPSVQEKLLRFKDETQTHVQFYLPQMHCSSCIWLLEHLHKLSNPVIRSQVDFLKKEVNIVFDHRQSSLREVAELLTAVGYEPHISLHTLADRKIKKYDRSAIYKIGIAGFCFGNIMMLSFPEYFSIDSAEDTTLKTLFSYLNLGLALPVFFYSASGFFISAWKSLRQKFLNIDAPIALAVLITFSRSVYEILTGTGAGYLDSMSGIVFFMLIGRFFQDKTWQTISFERDYTSYFPLGVTVLTEDGPEVQRSVSQLKTGDRIRIHHGEIIPADAILFLGKASIDYSFVTGESKPSERSIGEILYAGGKQTGAAIELEVVREVSQSYLTQLWNNDVFKEQREKKKISFIHGLSRYFTYALFSLVAATAIYWSINDPTKLWSSVTAMLIVACPCALLLSATFTNGNMLRLMQRARLYVKNANTIERMGEVDTLIFDKTGTITQNDTAVVSWFGKELEASTQRQIASLFKQSNHPLGKAVVNFLPSSKSIPVRAFEERSGKGLQGKVGDSFLKLGSFNFAGDHHMKQSKDEGSHVYVSVDGTVIGFFLIRNAYRKGLDAVIRKLKHRYSLAVISGDNEVEQERLQILYGKETPLLFHARPEDKLEFIRQLQAEGRKVMMIGDGLNDAGALMQSDVGVAVSDDVNNFSPACDAILDGARFAKLAAFLNYARKAKYIILGSFIISIAYNIVGLFYAMQGHMQPVIAAILMPLSSFTIMIFTTLCSTAFARPLNLRKVNTDKSHTSDKRLSF